MPGNAELQSHKFEERQLAEERLLKWAQEGEGEEEKVKALVREYFTANEPEEQFRLAKILFELKKKTVPQEGSGFIGITMDRRMAGQPGFEPRGALVTQIIEGTPAEKIGLKVGDLILKVNQENLAGDNPTSRLIEIVKGKAPGTLIELTVERSEEEVLFQIPLMNSGAVLPNRFGTTAKVDREKAEQLLWNDFKRWLSTQRER